MSTGDPSQRGSFPFGQPVRDVVQRDRTPKRVFVLGVYASAVHATWYDPVGKMKVRALAVASEPEIFWRGEGADALIGKIAVPPTVGVLAAAPPKFNGPSGRSLDDAYLRPLGVDRDSAWLCDLLPSSRSNPAQGEAIKKHYAPLANQGIVPPATIPPVPRRFTSDGRRTAVLEELRESRAELVILLGDVPLREFVSPLTGLADSLTGLTRSGATYGERIDTRLGGRPVQVLPLVHPRQVGRLGLASRKWGDAHESWIERAHGGRS